MGMWLLDCFLIVAMAPSSLGILPVRRLIVVLRCWQTAKTPAACWTIAFGSPYDVCVLVAVI
ncbi:hypothetical protein D3C86_2133280 [compost metagenome]